MGTPGLRPVCEVGMEDVMVEHCSWPIAQSHRAFVTRGIGLGTRKSALKSGWFHISDADQRCKKYLEYWSDISCSVNCAIQLTLKIVSVIAAADWHCGWGGPQSLAELGALVSVNREHQSS